MFGGNSIYDISKYIQNEPIIPVVEKQTPIVEKKVEKKVIVEEIIDVKPEDRLEKDEEMIQENETEIQEEVQEQVEELNKDIENLKNRILTVKNKPLFIKRNKDKIKSLDDESQREFLKIAKGIFDNL